MFDRRTKNAEIFKDTELMYRTNENLKAVVKKSMISQKLLLTDDAVDYEIISGRAGKVVVSGKRKYDTFPGCCPSGCCQWEMAEAS